MAQTKRKRRRKHRGTQAGTIERPGRTGRPQTKAEARKIARERRLERLDRPPTWSAAAKRAAIAAALFGGLVIAAFGQPPGAGVTLAALMFLLYIPMGYYTDLFIYRRRRRKAGDARSGDKAAKPGPRGDG
jgi:hypothetical protein